MEMNNYQLSRSSYQDLVKTLEADIQHANASLAAIPKTKGDAYFQMKLVHSQFAPLFFLFFRWLDAIMLPSLRRLHNDLVEEKSWLLSKTSNERHGNGIVEEMIEEECGICLELCTKIVLPGCYHALCINCYRHWNKRSESCPFCRGGLKRVKSEDLWVLTSESEVIDVETASREKLSRFYLYIQSLPKDTPSPFLGLL